MTITLTSKELDEIARLQSGLLAAEHLGTPDRIKPLLVGIRRLIAAERSFASYQFSDGPVFLSDGVGPHIADYFDRVFTGVDRDGNYLFTDKALQEINQRRRQMGAGVHHEARLKNRALITDADYFREAFEPAGMHHVIGMTTPLPIGEAIFAFGFGGPDDPGFSGERSIKLLNLLLPAFRAGFFAAWNLHAQQAGPASAPEHPKEEASEALTPRQREVAALIVAGLTDRQIALKLGISLNTVRRHSEAILSRLGLSSRSGLAARLGGLNNS
ncbi:helix-turn-helix transcriptional regulator [Histidinibacterium aquaticum]|nr:helix-turn-helix transcriptional regulator [Histidinibacterium aquaticum]